MITFRIKRGYHTELLTRETMKLFGSNKNKVTKNKNGEIISHLEINELHCNIVNNYPQKSRVSYAFVPNKSFDQLLDISPKNFLFKKTFNAEFSDIEVWFTDQNSKLLEKEDKISITLVINYCLTYKKWWAIQLNLEIEYF